MKTCGYADVSMDASNVGSQVEALTIAWAAMVSREMASRANVDCAGLVAWSMKMERMSDVLPCQINKSSQGKESGEAVWGIVRSYDSQNSMISRRAE